MKTTRHLLVVIFAVVSSLFATPSAGAVSAESSQVNPACDDIGPLPFRLTALGVGAPAGATLLAAPACMDNGDQADDATVSVKEPVSCQTIGPTAFRFVSVTGLSSGGPVASMAAPACMVSFDIAPAAAAPDARMCQANGAVLNPLHVCASPD